VRDRIRVYANGWSYKLEAPDDYVRAASAMVERGFTALKFDPLPGPWRSFIPAEHDRHAERVVAAMRKELGPEIDFLIEAHRRLAPMHAIRLAERLTPYNLYWYEEPCPSEDITALAEIRRHVSVPIVTGEALYTKAGFKPVFEHRAADIINPDVSNCGGILELVEIAAMAEAHAVAVSPHNYNSTALSLSATVHASARMPNFIITEYFVPIEEMSRRVAPNALVPRDGYLDLPTGPGLGLEIDEAVIASSPAKRYPARTFRTIREEGP
jgi:galactonate dehydratase